LAKIATLAAGAGILTGLLTVGAWFSGLAPLRPFWATLALAMAIILILDSFVTFVGPKRVFYVSALLSALLTGSEWIGSGSDATVVTALTIIMACVTVVLSMAAARLEPKISEQSHPMNLPVFG
jgi:Na+/melibiose symporter-like transporter